MRYLIDTDICSAHLKGVKHVTERFLRNIGGLHISAVTLGELYTWVFRAKSSHKRRQGLEDFLTAVTVVDVNQDVAHQFGKIRAGLLDIGRPVPSLDLLIASTALLYGYTMVTHNVQDFANVPDLIIEDWLLP